MTPQQRRVYWLKKVDQKKVSKSYKCEFEGCKKVFNNKRKYKIHQQTHKKQDKESWEVKKQEEQKNIQLNKGSILKLMKDIQESRGKNQMQNLKYLRKILEWQTGQELL